ncbi:hypothetical protein L596_008555 [Steinernema carpocapsae]|uniref:Uncharacterized protein n=1 Tax=Steinernema carpocapsae TaxID=34508 RepID=A0A4U5PDC7_STECR|nr:hypothetical protein L596_008555 [Steinernema carpocapsae]
MNPKEEERLRVVRNDFHALLIEATPRKELQLPAVAAFRPLAEKKLAPVWSAVQAACVQFVRIFLRRKEKKRVVPLTDCDLSPLGTCKRAPIGFRSST